MIPCRAVLHMLRCSRDGGHPGPHRSRLTVWPNDPELPVWLRRGLPAKDYTRAS